MAAKNQKGADPVSVDPSILDWAEYWYPISWKGVLFGGLVTAVGACATIGFLLLQWRTTVVRETQSELRTSAMETRLAEANATLGVAQADIAKANEGTAEANARTKEAELKILELKKQQGPRIIDGDAFKNAVKDGPKAKVELLFVPEDPETHELATQIRWNLCMSGWDCIWERPIRQPDSPSPNGSLASSVVARETGISLIAGDMDMIKEGTAYAVLFHAFKLTPGQVGMSFDPNVSPDVIRIVVAPKPPTVSTVPPEFDFSHKVLMGSPR